MSEKCNVVPEDQEAKYSFKRYVRTGISEMKPVHPFDTALLLATEGVSISEVDIAFGSPKEGDMIARNPIDHKDMWLVSKEYFEANLVLEDDVEWIHRPIVANRFDQLRRSQNLGSTTKIPPYTPDEVECLIKLENAVMFGDAAEDRDVNPYEFFKKAAENFNSATKKLEALYEEMQKKMDVGYRANVRLPNRNPGL